MKLNIKRKIQDGMWVMLDGKVGIIVDINFNSPVYEQAEEEEDPEIVGYQSVADFHLVNDKGVTTVIAPKQPLDDMSQAMFSDIPECRQPTVEQAAVLGYIGKSK